MSAEIVIDLDDLNGDRGFVLAGDAAGDQLGFSVSGAGDVNGDGIADLIIGAPFSDAGGVNAGVAYVVYGRSGASDSLDLTMLSEDEGFAIIGDSSGDNAGFSVSGAGDFNNDGIADLIVGAYVNDIGGTNAGAAYVVYGRTGSRGAVDLSGLVTADGFAITGAAGDLAGSSVSDAGDVNGDGIDDIVIGVPSGDLGGVNDGEAYVIYGHTGTRGPLELDSLAVTDGFAIIGNRFSDGAGSRVSGAGDINGDGIDDLIIGAPDGPFDDGDTNDGEVHVIYGRAGPREAINLTSVTAADGFTLSGDAQGEFTGFSVSDAGDVNGDGIDDLVVGASRGIDRGADGGEAYVVFGVAGSRGPIDLTLLREFDLSFGFAITGDSAFDSAGFSVSGAGDFNGDGIDDLIVGAPLGDDGGINAGEAYVVFGREGTRGRVSLTNLSADDGLTIVGAAPGDQAGFSVSGAGDVNGDDFADLIIGAPRSDASGADAGQAYVVFGRSGLPGNPGVTITGTAGNDIVSARVTPAGQPLPTDRDDTVFGEGGNDTLDAGAGNDRYFGGLGNDLYIIDSIGDVVIEEVAGLSGGVDTMQSANTDIALAANVENGRLTNVRMVGADLDIAGNGLDNTLTGNSGANSLDGGDGNDTLIGNAGNDTLIGGLGLDSLNGGAGNDKLDGGDSTDKLNGGNGNDVLDGGDGNDTLNGGANNDTLFGGVGDDILDGGAGADVLMGGTGKDQFRFQNSPSDTSIDIILDFSQEQRDIIHLAAIDANGTTSGNGKFTFIGDDQFTGTSGQLRYEIDQDYTRIFADIDGDRIADLQIYLAGNINLVSGDFVL
jgi:Ca2+-binding RTX toxin-like protein